MILLPSLAYFLLPPRLFVPKTLVTNPEDVTTQSIA
jgi:hypothetical protein